MTKLNCVLTGVCNGRTTTLNMNPKLNPQEVSAIAKANRITKITITYKEDIWWHEEAVITAGHTYKGVCKYLLADDSCK